MVIKELYLFRLFRSNKYLFFGVVLFICFQQYFYLKGNSTFPWFHWSMYSYPSKKPKILTQTEFYVNGQQLNLVALPIWQEATLLHTFNKYQEITENQGTDPLEKIIRKRTKGLPPELYSFGVNKLTNNTIQTNLYPKWLKNYLQIQVICQPVKSIDIRKVSYNYQEDKFTKEKFVPLFNQRY